MLCFQVCRKSRGEPEARAAACHCCGCTVLQGWGRYRKPVRDSQVAEVGIARYRCTGCERMFRHYPGGIGRGTNAHGMFQLCPA